MYRPSKTLGHEVRPKGSLGGVSGAAVGRSDGGATPRKIHFLPIFSPSTALSRLGWAGVKLRRQGLAGGGRGGLGGLSPQFAVWRYCGQGWAVRRPPSAAAVRRRSSPPAAAVRLRRLPLHQAQRAAVRRRCPLPSAVCCRPPPSAALRRVLPWGLLGGCPPCGLTRSAPPCSPLRCLPPCAHCLPPLSRCKQGAGAHTPVPGPSGRVAAPPPPAVCSPVAPPAWVGRPGFSAALPLRRRASRPTQGGRLAFARWLRRLLSAAPRPRPLHVRPCPLLAAA